MSLQEYREQLLAEARSLVPQNGEPFSVEDRKRYSQLMDRADLFNPKPSTSTPLGTPLVIAPTALTTKPEARSAGRPPRSQPGAETRTNTTQKAKQAFVEWMRSGEVSPENRSYLRTAESRAMGVGPVAGPITGGSVLVPTGFDPQLHSALKSYGALAGAVRALRTDSGEPMKVAFDDDTANSLQLVSELTAAPEVDPLVSGFTSVPDSLTTGLVTLSNQLLNDSYFNVDDFITNKFLRRYAAGLARMIAQGNGSNIQKLAPVAYVQGATGESTSVTLDNLADVYASIDPIHLETASWVMTSQTKAVLMKLKDNYGHPLLQPDSQGQPFATIYGRPIVISQFTDQLGAGNYPILFGDLEQSYTIRTVGGLEIARSVDRYFELNATAYVGWARVAGYNTSQASSPSLVAYKNSAS